MVVLLYKTQFSKTSIESVECHQAAPGIKGQSNSSKEVTAPAENNKTLASIYLIKADNKIYLQH